MYRDSIAMRTFGRVAAELTPEEAVELDAAIPYIIGEESAKSNTDGEETAKPNTDGEEAPADK